MELQTIVVASSNENKIEEIARFFEGTKVITMKEAGFKGDVEETGVTFAENAYIKASAVSRALGVCALADDSGLCVDALGGEPGIYSARYSGGDSAENRKLLLKNLGGEKNRRARFHCSICLCFPDGTCLSGEGSTYGTITYEERGEGGFGYDSLFLSDDLGITFGEATPEQKNAVSHRFRALENLRSKL